MWRIAGINCVAIAVVLALVAPARASAQASTLRVIGSDSLPIPFAWVSVEGATPNITNEKGELSLGKARDKTISVDARRIGYRLLSGTIDLPDTATVLTVMLSRVAQNLPAVVVNGTPQKSQLELVGFYSRWLQKQRDGLRDATFIGPEAIELRKPGVTTDLLDRILGVTLRFDAKGIRSVRGTGMRPSGTQPPPSIDRNECFMNVLVDGGPVCPRVGCHYVFPGDPPSSTNEDHSLDIDRLVVPKDIAGIEVYPRRDGMPDDVLKLYNGCGIVVIWTKGQR
jgi:hypothetical protein